ncbi:hypothetical protein HDV00_003427 [Rhizophlyctis rosea]|nr:hypothetical protein HDV00_003427 [Rhizophlyctis rosea]
MLGTNNSQPEAVSAEAAECSATSNTSNLKERVITGVFFTSKVLVKIFSEVPGVGILEGALDKLEEVYNNVQHSKKLAGNLMIRVRLLVQALEQQPIEKLRVVFAAGAAMVDALKSVLDEITKIFGKLGQESVTDRMRRWASDGYLEDFQALEQRLNSSQIDLHTALSLRQTSEQIAMREDFDRLIAAKDTKITEETERPGTPNGDALMETLNIPKQNPAIANELMQEIQELDDVLAKDDSPEKRKKREQLEAL